MNKEKLLKALHKLYREDRWLNDLFHSAGINMDQLDAASQDVVNQMFLDTATWALSIYEAESNIKVNSDSTYEDRRSAVIAKERTGGKLTLEILQNIANSWNNGEIDVVFENGKIHVTFSGDNGVPKDLDGFYRAINEAKPAHLAVVYTILYAQWRDVAKYTWGEAKAFTWAELRNNV
ncbi:MAG: DUF2313 domain-containing protein [Peptococcaceae bacterium]|nr:DUF2313 domain-containing protein [Peptococcaceae bacterium]